MNIKVARGVEGVAVYINDRRVAGSKPWGGGTILGDWDMPTKCDTECADPLWCIQRQLCKKETMKAEGPRDLEMEIAAMVRSANEVHNHLARLFRSCAPQCVVADNTAHLVDQLDNVIAGYRIRLGELPDPSN